MGSRQCSESVFQTYLTAPAAVKFTIGAGCTAACELIVTTTHVVDRAAVYAEAVTVGVSPILVEEVAEIDDVEGELNGIQLTGHLEAVLLTEVEVEMMLKGQVVSVSFVVFATMFAHVGIFSDPCLQQRTLHFLGEHAIKAFTKSFHNQPIAIL